MGDDWTRRGDLDFTVEAGDMGVCVGACVILELATGGLPTYLPSITGDCHPPTIGNTSKDTQGP